MSKEFAKTIFSAIPEHYAFELIDTLNDDAVTFLTELESLKKECMDIKQDLMKQVALHALQEIKHSIEEFGENAFYPSDVDEYVSMRKIDKEFSLFPFHRYYDVALAMCRINDVFSYCSKECVFYLFKYILERAILRMQEEELTEIQKEECTQLATSIQQDASIYFSPSEKEEFIKHLNIK